MGMRSVDHAAFWGDGSHIVAITRWQLHGCSQLHGGSYTVAVTRWQLHGGSYTVAVTRWQLHGGSYTVADTPSDSAKVTVLPLPLQWVPRFKSAQDERVFDI